MKYSTAFPKHRALMRDKLRRSGLPEEVSLLPIWSLGRIHFPTYSIAKTAISNRISLISAKILQNFCLVSEA